MLLNTHWHLFSLSLISLFFSEQFLCLVNCRSFHIYHSYGFKSILYKVSVYCNWATLVISWIDEWMVKVLMSKQKLVPSYPIRKSVKKLCLRFASLQHSENNQRKHFISKWNVILRVSVVLKRIVVDSDWHFDNLWGSHLQNQSELYHIDQLLVFIFLPLWDIRDYLTKKKEIRGRDNSRTWEGHKRDSRRTHGAQEGHHRVHRVH